MKKHIFILFLFLYSTKTFAACSSGFTEVIVKIIPDDYPSEVSWKIVDSQGNIFASGDSSISDTVCIPSITCSFFEINDRFGDGIIGPGKYQLFVNGILKDSNSNFGYQAQYAFNCPQGNYCTDPIPLTSGSHTAPFDNTWYDFTPTQSGNYLLNMCGLNTCDTKIWIYENCPALPYSESVQGTYAFNNDYNCGLQVVLNVFLFTGKHYLIRIGDNMDSCLDSIDFNFSFVGPVRGCMDINACNYNPIATENDSSCVYFPNPICNGPDLKLDSTLFVQSLFLKNEIALTCDVDEGCVTGYGLRSVIAFTSHIDNIGTQDFFIGNADTQPGIFNSNNCHGHSHYEGYGDYRLFDSNNNLFPAGHKNGYCVFDLCGIGQYTCGNMGISAGCYDTYESNTQCQWIDITDVPTGDYRIAVIINSKHLPDALGRYETNYINNAVQICVHIIHNAGGMPSYTLLPNCSPYIDCLSVPGGNAELDCNGVCNGSIIYGDVFQDAVIDSQDVYTYLDFIESSLPATNCNDLNRDGKISIYDASLVNWCLRGNSSHPGGSAQNHCSFPRNISNPNDTNSLSISNVDSTYNYLDIELLNPLTKVKAYQFKMSGITISSVISLASPVDFPVDVRFESGTNEVFAISLEDSSLQRSNTGQALVRIYFSAITDTQICINSITDIINQDAEHTVVKIIGNCTPSKITNVSTLVKNAEIVLFPNPAKDKIYIHLSEEAGTIDELTILDVAGKTYPVPLLMIKNSWYELDLKKFSSGVYIVRLRNYKSYGVSRFVKL